MSLIRSGLEFRHDITWNTELIQLQLCSGSWTASSVTAGQLIWTELLDNRYQFALGAFTRTWDTASSSVQISASISVTGGSADVTFNRLGLIRKSTLRSKYAVTAFGGTTVTLVSGGSDFAIGDSFVYNSNSYLITNVAGNVLTTSTSGLPGSGTGLGYIRSQVGTQLAGFVLATPYTLFAGQTNTFVFGGAAFGV